MDTLHIQEVMPRDGLQIEQHFLPTEDKIALINQLSECGLSKIEVTSFVSPKAVPNLKDGAEVANRITYNPEVTYVALVPNVRGAETALTTKINEINLVLSASHTHNLKNIRKTPEESLTGFKDIFTTIKGSNLSVNGALATGFGCPFEGPVDEAQVLNYIEAYLKLGVSGITLADTTGMANPRQVARLTKKVLQLIGKRASLTLHFHNTRGMGLANVVAAMDAGANRFDAALGGIGGCPFAPGATGNICTEDLVHMVEEMGYQTTVDLDKLLAISRKLPALLQRESIPGQVVKAGKVSDLHLV